MNTRKGPVVIEMQEAAAQTPATAPPVPDNTPPDAPQGRAMQMAMRATARRPGSRLARLAWGAFAGLLALGLSVTAHDFVTGLLARMPLLGGLALALLALLALALLALALRELAGFRRLARLDALRRDAAAALAAPDATAARAVVRRLDALYAGRSAMAWGRQRLSERLDEALDAETALAMAETELLAGLDQDARREVEAAARQVALVTAVVPMALADVAVALWSNLRMIRRIAEIYGGRAGVIGGWRLTRAVMTHLVATGLVSAGDDLLGSFAGGGILSKLSRRFGEGVVNGALTARVGVAAMEVCRPLPFAQAPRPGVGALLRRALTGLFER